MNDLLQVMVDVANNDEFDCFRFEISPDGYDFVVRCYYKDGSVGVMSQSTDGFWGLGDGGHQTDCATATGMYDRY